MIAYLIYSTFSLTLLLVIYRSFLENEKRFIFNRIFLLWSLAFSITIPLIPVGLDSLSIDWSIILPDEKMHISSDYLTLESVRLDSEASVSSTNSNTDLSSNDVLFTSIFVFYLTITTLLFLKFFLSLQSIQNKIRRNPKLHMDGYTVVLLKEEIIPHTFLNTIFLNEKQYRDPGYPNEVLTHEITHAQQKHSLDIIFVEIIKILFWFNPLVYFYKRTIAINHEYLADQAVISSGSNIQHYQRILINVIEGNAGHSLASSFNFSSIKNRLQIMTQSKTNTNFLIKSTFLIPLFFGMALLLGCTQQEPASQSLTINILDNQSMQVNESPMTLEEFEVYLQKLPEKPKMVYMQVSPNAPFGLVTDVQNYLKKHDALKIQYSSTRTNNRMSSPDSSATQESSKNDQTRIEVVINELGEIIMNEDLVAVNEVSKKVTALVNNENSTQSNALIVIKTYQETPYEQYKQFLNEIEAVKENYPIKLSISPPESI